MQLAKALKTKKKEQGSRLNAATSTRRNIKCSKFKRVVEKRGPWKKNRGKQEQKRAASTEASLNPHASSPLGGDQIPAHAARSSSC